MRLQLLGSITALALLATLASAQVPPGGVDGPTPEQQQVIQKFRDVQRQVMDNMQKQGIDPMQFMQDMQQKIQDGSFDINEFNQELVDKGLVDQASLTDLQTSAQKLTLSTLQKQLGMTDEEFATISPKIQAVLAAQAPAGARSNMGGIGGMGGFANTSNHDPELTKARRALHDAVKDKSTPNDVLTEKLKAYRDAKAAAVANLKSAQKDLADLLTMKQEAVMVRIGILD